MIVGLRQMVPNFLAHKHGIPKKPPVKILAGAKVGNVGASVVGKEVIRLLKLLGAKPQVFDPFYSAEQAAADGVTKHDDLLAMMPELDVLTIHTPLLPATRQQVHGDHCKALPDDAIIINAARGACIHENDLIAELQQGRLFAFLDVTDPKPAAEDSPLRSLANVVITSHVAGSATQLMGDLAVADVQAFLAGKAPRDVITQDMLEYTA